MMSPIQILLVEDNEADAFLTKEALEADRLHLEVTIARDGEEALRYLLREGEFAEAPVPDLLLLDLNLPKLDGQGVLEEMRKHERLQHVPVVVLSSSDADSDILRSYKLGANCYVTKPLGLSSFREIMNSVKHFWFTVVKLPHDRQDG